MIFEEKARERLFGERFGYIASYFLFTTVLYFLLKFLNKMPSASYFYFMFITLIITLAGISVKRMLK